MVQKKRKGTIRGRLSDGTPNPIDIYVGTRIRFRRTMLGLSQERLAEALGITFQQVQKYEKGLNRIGASRLWDLSQVLDVPVDFFFDKMDEASQSNSPRKISGFQLSDSDVPYISTEVFLRRDVMDLVRHYIQIVNPKISHNILELIKSIAPINGSDTNVNTGTDDPGSAIDSDIKYQPFDESDIDDTKD